MEPIASTAVRKALLKVSKYNLDFYTYVQKFECLTITHYTVHLFNKRILSFVIEWWICTQSWKRNLRAGSPVLGLGVTYLSRFPDIFNVDPLITGIKINVTQTCTLVTTSTLSCVWVIASVTMIKERVQRCSKMPVGITSHVMT